MNRRKFAFATSAVCAAPVLASKKLYADGEDGLRTKFPAIEPEAFDFGKEITVDLKAAPVKWQGREVHVLELAKFNFSINKENSQVKAIARGEIKSFDNVEYQIGVAIFDSDNKMLGTAKATCKVLRVWLGTYLRQPVSLEFDFGTSNNFSQAAKFAVSLSEETVLTPDQWQK